MSGQKIAIIVLILIGVLFAGGFLAVNHGNDDTTSAPWVAKLQALLPAGKSVTASEMSGPCLQGSTILVGLNKSCNIVIAGQGPVLRTLKLSLPAPPNPAAAENVDVDVVPQDKDSPEIKALLRASKPNQHDADLKITKSGANLTVTCKTAVQGACTLLIG